MKIFKKLISIFMVMQCIASCSLIGHAIEVAPVLDAEFALQQSYDKQKDSNVGQEKSMENAKANSEVSPKLCKSEAPQDSQESQSLGENDEKALSVENPTPQVCGEIDSSALSQENQAPQVLEENNKKDTTASASCTEMGGGQDNIVDKDAINIAMASDNNYTYPLIVAMTSILENKNPNTKIDFYIMLSGDFHNENKAKIMSLQKKYSNCRITLIDMKDRFKDAYSKRKLSVTAYYRLLLPSLLPNVDKIIWLDCDLLVFKDLTEMFNINIGKFYLMGILDGDLYNQENLCIVDDRYICSGVMLMDLKKLRENKIEDKFIEYMKATNGLRHFNDQTIINGVCHDQIGILPAKFGIFNFNDEKTLKKYLSNLWNKGTRYTKNEVNHALKNAVIVHCIWKPWKSPHVYLADCWWQYAEKTDYFKEIQAKYLPNSKSAIKAPAKTLEPNINAAPKRPIPVPTKTAVKASKTKTAPKKTITKLAKAQTRAKRTKPATKRLVPTPKKSVVQKRLARRATRH